MEDAPSLYGLHLYEKIKLESEKEESCRGEQYDIQVRSAPRTRLR